MHIISILTIVIVLIALPSQYFVAGSVSGPDDAGEIWVNEPAVLDAYEQPIHTIEVGENSTIRVSVTNNLEIPQSFVLLIEARDGQGVTMFLTFIDWSLIGGGNYTSDVVWTPTERCAGDVTQCSSLHQIRAFAISNLTNPEMLSHVSTFHDIAVVEAPFHGNRIYPFLLDGEEYTIQYSMDYGIITNVTVDGELRSMAFSLERVTKDTRLVLTLPIELTQTVFYGAPSDLPIFVGSWPAEQDVSQTEANVTWSIRIPEGSQHVEIASVI